MKSKCYTIVCYGDSAPPNWRNILEDFGIPCCVSPAHDKDKREDGSYKKTHYHIILMFDRARSEKTACQISKHLGGNEYAKPVYEVHGLYKYLTHEGQPDKAQYNKEDIVCYNGFDISKYDTKVQLNAQYELLELILNGEIHDFKTLCAYAYSNDMQDEVRKNVNYYVNLLK